jgi:hypothetical protein
MAGGMGQRVGSKFKSQYHSNFGEKAGKKEPLYTISGM